MSEVVPYHTDYEAVAAGAVEQVLGPTGALGDVLDQLTVNVLDPADCVVTIKDGDGSDIEIVPNGTAIGTYNVPIGARARNPTTPGWRISTGTTVGTVVAVGRFS